MELPKTFAPTDRQIEKKQMTTIDRLLYLAVFRETDRT
jgi:hypothetical protein